MTFTNFLEEKRNFTSSKAKCGPRSHERAQKRFPRGHQRGQEMRPPPGAGGLGRQRASGRLQLRVSAQRPRTMSCHLTASGHLLRDGLTASPQQRLSFPHLLDFVNHPVSPQRPGELVSPTRGEGASSSCLSAPPQKL